MDALQGAAKGISSAGLSQNRQNLSLLQQGSVRVAVVQVQSQAPRTGC